MICEALFPPPPYSPSFCNAVICAAQRRFFSPPLSPILNLRAFRLTLLQFEVGSHSPHFPPILPREVSWPLLLSRNLGIFLFSLQLESRESPPTSPQLFRVFYCLRYRVRAGIFIIRRRCHNPKFFFTALLSAVYFFQRRLLFYEGKIRFRTQQNQKKRLRNKQYCNLVVFVLGRLPSWWEVMPSLQGILYTDYYNRVCGRNIAALVVVVRYNHYFMLGLMMLLWCRSSSHRKVGGGEGGGLLVSLSEDGGWWYVWEESAPQILRLENQ